MSIQNIAGNSARATAALAAVVLLAASPAGAQAPAESPSFGEIVDVRVVNLEVVVTDDGERVAGLGAGDFELRVDGEPVAIEYFTEVRGGRAVAGGESAETFAVPALQPGEAVGTRYLVFIDDFFAVPTYRNRALARLAEQLPLMGADDQMAIVAFDGRQIELLSSWTRSLAELSAALDQATQRRAYGLQRVSEQQQFDTTVRFRGRGPGGTRFASTAFAGVRRGFLTLDGLERQRAAELASQVEQVADAATSALRAFARPPGRKVMLLLSGGWPTSIASWVAGTYEPVFDDAWLGRYRPFEPLVETANRLGYTLYPVDLNGLDRASGNAEFGSGVEASLASARRFNREQLEEDILYELAAATGGRAFVDGASATALEGAIEDTRSYYWLGFAPAWKEDDAAHEIDVRVQRKGAKARFRGGYSDLSRSSELTMMVDSAQLFDLPLLGESSLGVSFGTPADAGFRRVSLPVRLEIPLDAVILPAGAGAAPLELRVAATDSSGDRSDTAVMPIALSGTASAAAGQVAVFETALKLRRQPHRLLISVYDPASGNLLSKRVEVSL